MGSSAVAPSTKGLTMGPVASSSKPLVAPVDETALEFSPSSNAQLASVRVCVRVRQLIAREAATNSTNVVSLTGANSVSA
jgi:hypothetical protein